MGIYITTAVKSPKSGYSVDNNVIRTHALILEEELKIFPGLNVIMLMGDVAKKAFKECIQYNYNIKQSKKSQIFKKKQGQTVRLRAVYPWHL